MKKHKLKIYCFLLFLFYLPILSNAQNNIVEVRSFGVEEGLSHRNVSATLQDRRGLMWFATDNGLNYFDGYHFKSISKEEHGLQSNLINSFYEDNDGIFWLMYGYSDFSKFKLTGIDLVQPLSKEVQPFESYFEGKTELLSSNIIGVTQKENGNLVFLSNEGKLVSYIGDGEFLSIPLKNRYKEVDKFHWSPNGYYWFSAQRSGTKITERLVIAINEKGEEVYSFSLQDPKGYIFFYTAKNSLNEKWISIERFSKQSKFIFNESTPEGKLIHNTEAPIYSAWNLDFSYFMKIASYVDGGEFSCFNSAAGFYLVEKDQPKLYNLGNKFKDLQFTRHLYIDKQQRIWASTQFGVYLITIRENRFSKILYQKDIINPIRSMVVDKDKRIWINREGHRNIWIAQLDSDQQTVIGIDSINKTDRSDYLPFSTFYYPLLQTKNGWIYYPSNKRNLTGFNPKNREQKTLTLPNYKGANLNFRKSMLWGLFEASNGIIWATSDNGSICAFGKEAGEWSLLPEKHDFKFLAYQILEEGDSLWVVTEQGLFIFDTKSKQTIARYWSGGKGKYHLPYDNLLYTYRDNQGAFWLGTKGNGLIHFNHNTGDYQQYTIEDGLSNNVIYAIYPESINATGGNLWFSSDYGIMRFNPAIRQVNTYLEKDGITHHEFNRISHFQAEDGTIFFGSLNGITAFHPKDFPKDSVAYNTPLVISSFQQFIGKENKLVDKTLELISTNEIVMAHNDPLFHLEFSLLNYEEPEKENYAYKIKGQGEDWFYQKENFINLSRLPYGQHILRIKGQGADGQWSTNELSIQLRVIKPFYLRIWFFIIGIAFIVGIIYLLFKTRNDQLKKQKESLEVEVALQTKEIRQQADKLISMDKLKSKVFANISHELRTPLTLILGPVSSVLKSKNISSREKELLKVAKQNTTNLSTLVNEILDLTKFNKSQIELQEKPIELYYLTKRIAGQYESLIMRYRKKLTFDYKPDKNLTILLDQDKFRTVLNNFISNSIKHTQAEGNINVTISDREDSILIKVADNGNGIHPDDLPFVFDRYFQSKHVDTKISTGTGIGLALCKEIAKLHNGNIWVESVYGKGSSFYFSFPKKEVDPLTSSLPLEVDKKIESSRTSVYDEKRIKQAKYHSNNNMQKDKILIVEDNHYLQDYLKVILDKKYKVILVNNGKQALDYLTKKYEELPEKDRSQFWLSKKAPSLIISDVMMPVMDGFELLKEIKNQPDWQLIPVIMLTALAGMEDKLKALRIGVDDYMIKPFEENELLARVFNMVANFKKKVAYASEPIASLNSNMAQPDQDWLNEIESVFLEYLAVTNFNMDWATQKLHLSKRQMERRLKQLTGLTPHSYLLELRLQKAQQLILEKKYKTTKEVAYAVGFKDPKYFSRKFYQRFGKKPSDYQI